MANSCKLCIKSLTGPAFKNRLCGQEEHASKIVSLMCGTPVSVFDRLGHSNYVAAKVRVLLVSAGEAGERPEDTFRKRGGWIGMDRGYRGLDGVRAKLDIGKIFDIWNQINK
jgi:hypothetical protein